MLSSKALQVKLQIERTFTDLLRTYTDIHEFDRAAEAAIRSFAENKQVDYISGYLSTRGGTVDITAELDGHCIVVNMLINSQNLLNSARKAAEQCSTVPPTQVPMIEDSFFITPRNATLAYDLAMKGITPR